MRRAGLELRRRAAGLSRDMVEKCSLAMKSCEDGFARFQKNDDDSFGASGNKAATGAWHQNSHRKRIFQHRSDMGADVFRDSTLKHCWELSRLTMTSGVSVLLLF